jgi:hypothetical protein
VVLDTIKYNHLQIIIFIEKDKQTLFNNTERANYNKKTKNAIKQYDYYFKVLEQIK